MWWKPEMLQGQVDKAAASSTPWAGAMILGAGRGGRYPALLC